MIKNNRLIGGILLVAGTTIGAGMLALPVITGFAGFFPSILLLVLFWIYMTYTALLILEVNLSMESNTNLVIMARRTLGLPGEWVAWITYFFLLYSLTTAYLAGSGPIIIECVKSLTGYTMPIWMGVVPLLTIFGYIVFKGIRFVDYFNRILMILLTIAFIGLISLLTPHVEMSLITHSDVKYLFMAVAIISTSFGFHIIIPSLSTYMEHNIPQLKKVIWIGGLIPLVVYIIWEFLTLSIVPLEGINGIKQGYIQGSNGAHMLSETLHIPQVVGTARFFSFFVIVTSFLGVSLSLFDCLEDSLKIKDTKKGRMFLFVLTFLPPLIFALIDPRAFLTALEYAGAFGVVILLGILPALMAWSNRYWKNQKSPYQVPGGKICLILVIVFSALVILIELINKTGLA